ncbi:MAG: EAL domain-containing protein, partial [Nitriliruptoraceae bacterium]
AIVRSTIALSHDLGFRVVAEGVEDEVTEELLRELGADEAQGYRWTRPLPADEFVAWGTACRADTPRDPPRDQPPG